MKNVFVILVIVVIPFLSCGEQEKRQRKVEWNSEEVVNSLNTDIVQDTVQAQTTPKEEAKPTLKPASSSFSLRTSSKSGYEEESDNMRGYDPASEDDMDDNGMSRYMENNDEEGWD